jgi:hypothetical protein
MPGLFAKRQHTFTPFLRARFTPGYLYRRPRLRRQSNGVTDKPAIDVDEALWPLVIFRFNGPRSEADWKGMFSAFARIHMRNQRYATINDTRYSALPSAVERALIGKYAKEQAYQTRRYLVSTSMVIENPIMRGVVTAIHWVYQPDYNFSICGTLEEAYVTTAQQLRAEGIAIHPDHASLMR